MKPIVCLLWCGLLLHGLGAQPPALPITTNKTTSLIFPYAVRHVDRGTADVLVQPVKGAENILLLKAACAGFAETNLSVVTEDGSLYSFLVTYQPAPSLLTYELPLKTAPPPAQVAAKLRDNPLTLRGIGDRAWGVKATLQGLYIQGAVMYFQLCLKNDSPVDYPLGYLRFAVRDPRKAKRTAVQEVELSPLYTLGNTTGIKAFRTEMIVVALPAFTLPDQTYLAIEVGEKSGGRHLSFPVKNRTLLRAVPLPERR